MKNFLDLIYYDAIRLVDRGNFEDPPSNDLRFEMLMGIRRYFPDFQKGGISEVKEWNLVRLGEEDLSRLLLINAGDRRQMSGGTLKPMDAAKRIEDGIIFSGGDVQKDANFIRDNAEKLAVDTSRIVLVGPESESLTVVDGVHRITALFLHYFVRTRGNFNSREAYHGISQRTYNFRFG